MRNSTCLFIQNCSPIRDLILVFKFKLKVTIKRRNRASFQAGSEVQTLKVKQNVDPRGRAVRNFLQTTAVIP